MAKSLVRIRCWIIPLGCIAGCILSCFKATQRNQQLKPGVRVVRGPDWNHQKQDSGEGHLGTVIFVPKQGSDDNKVTVIWDSGREITYRAGQDGKYDLRIFDTAQIGVTHPNIVCDACEETPIVGMRWKCDDCDDYDLCTPCYMSGHHETSHHFLRIDVDDPSARRWAVPPRNKSRTAESKGIFPGTKVMRGPHWKWRNQDGGESKEGVVKEINTWSKTSFRGGVLVTWKLNKETHKYRVGGEGSVDLVFTRTKETASGGQYYVEHLPLCDVVRPGVVQLRPSDKVTVQLSAKAFQKIQEDSYNWHDDMKQCVQEIGTIIQIVDGGKAAQVQYEDSSTWTINRTALNRKHTFSKDEVVQVLNDYNVVQELQQGHGGWNDAMQKILGKCGNIVKIDTSGDVLLRVGSSKWVLSPVCINVVSKDECQLSMKDSDEENSDSDSIYSSSDDENDPGETLTDVADAIAKLFVQMLRPQHGVQTLEENKEEVVNVNLVQAATAGNLKDVQSFIKKYPDKVDEANEEKTALQLACYEGHIEIVKFLLQNKANINWKDNEGDTPLHYAVHGKELGIMDCLIQHEANINATNKKDDTPLHISISKAYPEAAALLIKQGANVNIKDKDGDTAMHDAVQQKEGQPQIMEHVLKARGADYSIVNGKGFNVLHWATIRNNKEAVVIILKANKEIVNSQMEDEKATALHLAAVNNHVEIVNCLLKTTGVKKDLGNKSLHTPLHLAIIQGHKQVVDLLVAAKCDVNAQDDHQNSPLHLALSKQSLPKQLKELMGVRKSDNEVNIEIICLLLESKADLTIKNSKGMTPVDLVGDDSMLQKFMKRMSHNAINAKLATTSRGCRMPMHWDYMGKERFKRVKLVVKDNGTAKMEYDNVAKKFHHTLPQATIVSLERIQNVYLWEVFCMMKKRMTEPNERETECGLGNANELDLFHGTKPKWIDSIANHNVDFRRAGERVGAVLGKGAYFAVDAKYSDKFAECDEHRRKFMIMVKVMVGKYCVGDAHYTRPPHIEKNDDTSPMYQSCVDNMKNPAIYCLFDKNQYYPEYIIEYK